ncbi:hypothetical protein DCC85_11390 [Paenibacillus sp. CAA11]|uniref:YqeB family protein n=1 Tax=Paenibacillus sp. CAA11 TaxID=1532905 RepID=UPI000D3CEBB5|nr:hypothetical protein [Paenibacillus sp. CAA11]AWB44759.1 hypothetical protein DCC85_11390 [Paenibacillus sp. CAA11]
MSAPKTYPDSSATIVGFTKSALIMMYGGLGVVGAVIGYFIPSLAKWLLNLPWFPFEGPLKLIRKFDGPWLPFILGAVGLIIGVILAYIVAKETLRIILSDASVRLVIGDYTQDILREEMGSVFLDKKHLVILGRNGFELAREQSDESANKVAEAFKRHGYPWLDSGDPYKEEFCRWVPETPDLPAAANALLKARESALKKDEAEDIRDLRRELAKLGYIIRDEKSRQFWRKAQ